MERTILHCDCNAFYASVETVFHPEYAQKPMAVCGDAEARHGIVLAKNDLAKKTGIRTGEAIWQAKQKCPSLTVVYPHQGLYSQYSRAVRSIYAEYTDRIEPFGLDENWLDVTDLLGRSDGAQIADELRARVRRELGITISAGVSFTKTFAKLGSDYRKPDATTVIPPNDFRRIVFPLPVGDLLFAGKRVTGRLKLMGIMTIGDLARSDPSALSAQFGKLGLNLHAAANGQDGGEVARCDAEEAVKSVGNGFTFRHDLTGEDELMLAVRYLAEKVAFRLRDGGWRSRTVSVGIRDNALGVISRQTTLREPTFLASTLFDTAYRLIAANRGSLPIRSLYVTASMLIPDEKISEQMFLFPTEEQQRQARTETLEQTLFALRKRFGRKILFPSCFLGNDLGV